MAHVESGQSDVFDIYIYAPMRLTTIKTVNVSVTPKSHLLPLRNFTGPEAITDLSVTVHYF